MTGPQPSTPYTDIGDWLARAALTAVVAAIEAAGLEVPEHAYRMHGSGIVIADPCDGLLWARNVTTYPSDGSGNPYLRATADFSVPAWAHALDVGIVWCRNVVDEDGAAVDFDYETAIAERDSNYRMALIDGIANYFPAEIKGCALGHRISPWTPIGPEGAWSGGLVQDIIITAGLAVTLD